MKRIILWLFLISNGKRNTLDISTPTGINFKGAKYVIYFNPINILAA